MSCLPFSRQPTGILSRAPAPSEPDEVRSKRLRGQAADDRMRVIRCERNARRTDHFAAAIPLRQLLGLVVPEDEATTERDETELEQSSAVQMIAWRATP